MKLSKVYYSSIQRFEESYLLWKDNFFVIKTLIMLYYKYTLWRLGLRLPRYQGKCNILVSDANTKLLERDNRKYIQKDYDKAIFSNKDAFYCDILKITIMIC